MNRRSDFVDSALEAAFDLSQVHSQWVGLLTASGILLVIGLVDTSVFRGVIGLGLPYAAPVAIASWMVSRRAGLLFVLITCSTRFLVVIKTATLPVAPSVMLASALVQLTTLSLLAILTSSLKRYVGFHRSDALTDDLTGLANRRALLGRLKLEIERSARTGRPLSVIFGDLDDFKEVNDTEGHEGGDRFLRQTAAALLGHFRSTDLVCRYGGDEFVVLLPETGNEEALRLAQRAVNLISRLHARIYRPAISMGVVTFVQPPASPEVVLSAADELLYSAKAKKNPSRFASVRLPDSAS